MIVGKKIKLRALEEGDAIHTLELRDDYEAMKLFGGIIYPVNLESEKYWISNLYPQGERDRIYFAIIEKSTDEFIGYAGIRKISMIHRNGEIGLFIKKSFRGKGYGKEAFLIFFDYLFSQIGIHKVYGIEFASNIASVENNKKLGFKEEGILKEHYYQDGQYKDMVFIGLTDKDFYETNKDNFL